MLEWKDEPGWWNGRHEGLKIPWALGLCGFKSRPRHPRFYESIYAARFQQRRIKIDLRLDWPKDLNYKILPVSSVNSPAAVNLNIFRRI